MPFCNLRRGEPVVCGLIFYPDPIHYHGCRLGPVPVPLKAVNLTTKVVDFVAEVSLEQEYVNRECRPIEATYLFPVEEEAAVVDFQAEVDGRVISTRVEEKEKARKEYKEAIEKQQTAVLLEESKPDVFQIKIGHLKPGSAAKVTIKYVVELPVAEEDKSCVRLSVPTTIAPRYTPPTDNSEAAKQLAGIKYTMDSPADLTIQADILSKHRLKSVTSPSHSLKEQAVPQDEAMDGMSHIKTGLRGHVTDLDRDFILLISAENISEPVLFLETCPERKNTLAGMVSLVPDFKLDDQKTELIFLVDRSGSMGWGGPGGVGNIQHAKEALNLFLHSLPVDCIFDIYSFGSRFDSLFGGNSAEYTDDSLQKAKSHVQTMAADYGGTEIYKPLESIFNKAPKEGFLRQIFVLTDGAVSNEGQVISLVRKHNHQGRIFSLGLGAGASRHLVKGIARAGGGTAAFSGENEDLRPKVMSQLKNALQPAISDITIQWQGVAQATGITLDAPVEKKKTLLGYMKPKNIPKVTMYGQAPARIPPIYDGHRLLAYRLFEAEEMPTGVLITAQSPDGPLKVELALKEEDSIEGTFVHQLAARKRIQDLEEEVDLDQEAVKQAITNLGLEYKLASKHTSFIGVDPKESDRRYNTMATRDVPNMAPAGFGAPQMKSGGFSFGAAQAQMCAFGGGGGGGAFGQPQMQQQQGGVFGQPPMPQQQQMMGTAFSSSAFGAAPMTFGATASAASAAAPSAFGATSTADLLGFDAGAVPINSAPTAGDGLFGGFGSRSNSSFGGSSNKSLPPPPPPSGAAPWGGSSNQSTMTPTFGAAATPFGGAFGSSSNQSVPPPPPPAHAAAASPFPPPAPGGLPMSLVCGFAETDSTAMSKAEKVPAKDTVDIVMDLQSSSGAYRWDDVLIGMLGVESREVLAKRYAATSVEGATEESVWVTLAVVSFLGKECGDKKDLWELMATKAIKWLKKRLGVEGYEKIKNVEY